MQDNTRGEHKDTPSDPVNKIPRECKLEALDDFPANAIRLRVVTVSQDQSEMLAKMCWHG